MTERERNIRKRAQSMGVIVQKSYGARFEFTRTGKAYLVIGMREAEVWLAGYEAGLARVFAARAAS